MDDTAAKIRLRRSRNISLLCCCCSGSDDSTAERSLLKPSWFHKVTRTNSGPEAAAMDVADSPHWWRKGLSSVKRAGEWSESLVEDYVRGGCRGAKWKQFVRRCKTDGKTIYDSRPASFQYDRMSYHLNFDDGDFEYWRMNFPNPKQYIVKDLQTLNNI